MLSTDGATSDMDKPLQTVTNDNHGPWVVITAFLFLFMSLISITVKVIMRWRATGLQLNDYLISVAGLLMIIQTILLTVAENNGLGRHRSALDDSSFEVYGKAYYASNIFLLPILAAAKVAVTGLVISIHPPGPVVRFCYGVVGFVLLWAVASVLALIFQCHPPQPWNEESNTCVDQYGLQISIGVINILTDLVIIAVPLYIMHTVKIAKSKKWIVSSLFACRIVTPGFTIACLVTMRDMYKTTPPDRPWQAVNPAIWTQVMANSSIITACIPSLKPFLADIRSGLTGLAISEPIELGHSSGKSAQRSTNLNSSSGSAFRLSKKFNFRASRSANAPSRPGTWAGSKDDPNLASGRTLNMISRGGDRDEGSESVKGLTNDVIMQTVGYNVEYDDGSQVPSEGHSSPGHPTGEYRRGSD